MKTTHRIAAEKFIEGYDKEYHFSINDLGNDGCKLTGTYAINQYRDDEITFRVREGEIYHQYIKSRKTKKGETMAKYDTITGELLK